MDYHLLILYINTFFNQLKKDLWDTSRTAIPLEALCFTPLFCLEAPLLSKAIAMNYLSIHRLMIQRSHSLSFTV